MHADRPSSTSLLIVRGLLLAEATPRLRPLLIADTAARSRRLLQIAEPAGWFQVALRSPLLRWALFAAERLFSPGIVLHWMVRKRLLDQMAHAALEAGCQQLVVIGAGMDILALRLQAKAVCFELDHPATQATKRRAFPEGPTLVPTDLLHTSVAETLRAQPGFDAGQPTLFVAEGLLMYLPEDRVRALMGELVAVSAPGSRFAFTFLEDRPGQRIGFQNGSRVTDWWLRGRSEPFRWALERAKADPFLAELGWKLESLSSPDEFRRLFLESAGLGDAPLAIGESVALATLRASS